MATQDQPQSGYNQYNPNQYASQESVELLRKEIENHYATKNYVLASVWVPSLSIVVAAALIAWRILPNFMK